MRSLSRCLLLVALTAALGPGCDVIPINIPDPAAAPDGGDFARDAGQIGGGDMSSADLRPSNGPDGAPPHPVLDATGGGDGPGFTGDALPDAIGDGLTPPDGGVDVTPLEGGAPDSLTPDSLTPDSGAPDTLEGTDSTSPDL